MMNDLGICFLWMILLLILSPTKMAFFADSPFLAFWMMFFVPLALLIYIDMSMFVWFCLANPSTGTSSKFYSFIFFSLLQYFFCLAI